MLVIGVQADPMTAFEGFAIPRGHEQESYPEETFVFGGRLDPRAGGRVFA